MTEDDYRQQMINEGYTPSEMGCGQMVLAGMYMLVAFFLLGCIGFMCQHG